MKVRALSVLLTVLTAVLAVEARAQESTFRSSVDVVEIDVSVMRGGRPVAGLAPADFIVVDNGQLQTIDSASLDTLPLNVTLLLDTSASVSGTRLDSLIGASDGLTRALKPGEQASLMTFTHAAELRVPMAPDMKGVRSALGLLHGAGATALRDAVYLAMVTSAAGRARTLVLLFSDGVDTASWLTERDVIEAARRTNVVVHVVRFGSDNFVEQLAEVSGGRTWSAASDRDLKQLFSRALDEMRARYRITYRPEGVLSPGWHDIDVRLKSGRGEVAARPGYFVGQAPDR